ncbi:MAG: tRNA (adenosine(37)-N6)-threonylcarbamoyltransferase complex transferase subunit TsaD [Armatimonadetes bacterium]|nr:tRNA (adenosine(37)-N6)-threonylcarbamoyltransferase complex transferase subunit TsaD [Armatimonadota bacterium]
MVVLGIETSCDETAAALLRDGREVVSSVVASQADMHRAYGGVVPEIAFRKHLELVNPVLDETLRKGGLDWPDVNGVAVSNGPGLVGALLVGVASAKVVAGLLEVPLIGVNHLEAHVYANFLQHDDITFPLVCLLVSGGHTIILHMPSHGMYQHLGETRDDAAGEAFDKVARLLGLGYPGGPVVDRLARDGDPHAIAFPRAWMGEDSLEFSFSGLKTAVRNFRKKSPDARVEDVCASFQDAVVDVLVGKTMRAAARMGVRTVLMAGGVACNGRLRERMQEDCERRGLALRYPRPGLCTDNALMVACAGHHQLMAGQRSGLELDCFPVLPVKSAS